jgi:hypothetical protein
MVCKSKLYSLYPLLNVLARMEPEDRQTLIPFLKDAGCEAIYECIHNGLCSKDIPKKYRKHLRKKLKPDEDHFRCILDPNACGKKQLKKLQQIGGGGLGAILGTVLPILADYLQEEDD